MAATTTGPVFSLGKGRTWEPVGEGVQRHILAHGPDLMLVKVAFEAGSIGALHQHRHTQITYVESGEFEVTVGEETRVLRTGDTFYAAPNIWHGVKCLAAGTLLDSFSPLREDFLT